MAYNGQAAIEREKALLEAAKAKLSPEDKTEIQYRQQAEKLRTERVEQERIARDLDLARRLDSAREQLGEGAKLRELAIPEHPHTFIVKDPGATAYKTWEKDIGQVAMGKGKATRDEITRAYALKAVHDWNGITEFDDINPATKTTRGAELVALLTEHPAIATRIQNEAIDLAGLATEERKS